ncbi:MAG: hypothetical protein ACFNS7_04520 [Capnocytophaga granulosa]
MKKQIVQTLWHIANGRPQEQGEKVVYPNIREQLNAIKALMSIDGWDELDLQEDMPAPVDSSCPSITSGKEATSHQQTTTIEEKKASEQQEPTEKEVPEKRDAVTIVVQEQPSSQQSLQQSSAKRVPKKMSVGRMKRILRRGKLVN